MESPVSRPFTISWKNSTMAYAVQNERRVTSRVRATHMSNETTTATAASAVHV